VQPRSGPSGGSCALRCLDIKHTILCSLTSACLRPPHSYQASGLYPLNSEWEVRYHLATFGNDPQFLPLDKQHAPFQILPLRVMPIHLESTGIIQVTSIQNPGLVLLPEAQGCCATTDVTGLALPPPSFPTPSLTERLTRQTTRSPRIEMHTPAYRLQDSYS
jgi:hypothetical protein